MSQVTVTTTATAQHVTALCSCASPSMTVMIASTFVGLIILGQHDVVLLPQLIPWDTWRGSVGLTTMPQQQQT